MTVVDLTRVVTGRVSPAAVAAYRVRLEKAEQVRATMATYTARGLVMVPSEQAPWIVENWKGYETHETIDNVHAHDQPVSRLWVPAAVLRLAKIATKPATETRALLWELKVYMTEMHAGDGELCAAAETALRLGGPDAVVAFLLARKTETP